MSTSLDFNKLTHQIEEKRKRRKGKNADPSIPCSRWSTLLKFWLMAMYDGSPSLLNIEDGGGGTHIGFRE